MLRQGRSLAFLIIISTCLSGCIGSIWTGATLVYDRHNGYKKLNDYRLMMETTNVLYVDKTLKAEGCSLDLVVFNGDILVSGHLPSEQMLNTARNRLSKLSGYRRLFNKIRVKKLPSNNLQDAWITTKIRSQIFADDSIDPNEFKVITTDRIVYLMGDVKPEQAEKVIKIARQTTGVELVVKLLEYYTYEPKQSVA